VCTECVQLEPIVPLSSPLRPLQLTDFTLAEGFQIASGAVGREFESLRAHHALSCLWQNAFRPDQFHSTCIPLRTVVPSEARDLVLPATAVRVVQARTQIPRFARDDNCVVSSRYLKTVAPNLSEKGSTRFRYHLRSRGPDPPHLRVRIRRRPRVGCPCRRAAPF